MDTKFCQFGKLVRECPLQVEGAVPCEECLAWLARQPPETPVVVPDELTERVRQCREAGTMA
jgi:hypothetical protein